MIRLALAVSLVFACIACSESLTPGEAAPTEQKAGTTAKGAASSLKLHPLDESNLDPSFAEFKAKLQQAVEKRDRGFVVSAVAERIRTLEGAIPAEQIVVNWFRDPWAEEEWRNWRDRLALGATREGNKFCFSYVTTRFPALSAYDYVVITDKEVDVHSEPKSTSPVIEILSYDIVKNGPAGQRQFPAEEIAGERYHWEQIITPRGKLGYVYGKYVHSPLEGTACYAKVEGEWKLVSLVAGD